MENMLPGLHGDVSRRSGTRFLGDLGGRAVLIPFSFSAAADQNFVLVFGEKTLRIAHAKGLDPAAPIIETPYAAEDLLEISHAQVGDVVYLAHRGHPLHKVVRREDPASGEGGYLWSLEPVILNTGLPAPAAPAVSFSGSGGSFTLRYKVAAVDKNGRQSLPSPVGEGRGARHPSDWVQGNSANISWQAVEGATEYNVYREEAGYFGFIGIASGTSFSDQNYQADVSDTPREDWNPFCGRQQPRRGGLSPAAHGAGVHARRAAGLLHVPCGGF